MIKLIGGSAQNILFIIIVFVIFILIMFGIYYLITNKPLDVPIKPLVVPNKTVIPTFGGTDLSSYWINSDSTGSHYMEAELSIPSEFTSNHVIFDAGGPGYGTSLLIINENNEYNIFFGFCNSGISKESFVKVPVKNIPKFLGNKGILGWSIENVELNKWRVRLFWNNKLLAESEIINMEVNFFTGGDPFGYLKLNSGLCYKYNNLVFTVFPNAEKQGELKLYNNYILPPNNYS